MVLHTFLNWWVSIGDGLAPRCDPDVPRLAGPVQPPGQTWNLDFSQNTNKTRWFLTACAEKL